MPHSASSAITDVAGIEVGHFTDLRRPTGCTVILARDGVVAGVDGRGAPLSRLRRSTPRDQDQAAARIAHPRRVGGQSARELLMPEFLACLSRVTIPLKGEFDAPLTEANREPAEVFVEQLGPTCPAGLG